MVQTLFLIDLNIKISDLYLFLGEASTPITYLVALMLETWNLIDIAMQTTKYIV